MKGFNIWGHLEEEDRYDLFEKALYTTVQRPDETNDSYLAMISLLRS